ncbi:MAG: NADH-quinone oxidoreductase subunit C [Dehalococcoidia bacterium]|jgi:NADH-quinone oxidoreductase subunit C|nr:NADH-quinone oxidoreductase subunit C [Dehalococcoidia bacterium]|tara:strand:+ start:330 stop:836 length:507 start_codon:yes stop_codon:yes gene_type:complete
MTTVWSGKALAEAIEDFAPGSVEDSAGTDVWLKAESIAAVCQGLKQRPEFKFDLLNSLTAVDYIDHYEVVYHLTSLPMNASAVLKSRVGMGRTEASVPSVVSIWRGADYQEREVWDLMGIRFDGHPNHKRIMLWEGFPGHPLRKDYVTYDQSIVNAFPSISKNAKSGE